MHICVGKLTIIGSDNGLSPGRHQAMIIGTNAGILLIGSMGTNLSEILIEIHTFSFKKIHLKMSSGKWPPFCLGLNVLRFAGSLALGQSCTTLKNMGEINHYPNTTKYEPCALLQWHASVKASQISDNSIACSTACSGYVITYPCWDYI